MTFLQKKLQETIPEIIYKQILLIEEGNLADFEELYDKTLSTLSAIQLNTLLDFLVAKKKISKEIKVSFLQKLLSHQESFLREKVVLYLESLLQKDCVSSITPLRADTALSVRARIFWVLAKYTTGDEEFTQQIIKDLKASTIDNDQVLLAAALYQRNNTSASLEMQFLRDFYLENYIDLVSQELKVNLTGKHGFAAQMIGLILWEANIKIYAIDSLKTYNMQWLVEKTDEKVSL